MVTASDLSAGNASPLWLGYAVGHKNMRQLILLRWVAIVGQIATITTVTYNFDVSLPLPRMAEVLAVLVAFNIGSHLRWQERPVVADKELFAALLVDVMVLTAQLYLSGGTTNPFVFLYLLQVSLGAVLLKTRWSWMLVAITATCLAGLAWLAPPLTLPPEPDHGVSRIYIQGLMLCFALNAILLVASITQISRNLREQDTRLANLRQRAAEHEHIVRIGLLASGAAHELGTPLATLDVLLGDWQHLPLVQNNPEMLQELQEAKAQVKRCKRTLSGILLSAGETRGESSAKTSVHLFFDTLVENWRGTRNGVAIDYHQHFNPDATIAADSTVEQMVCNVLDNALEASPDWLSLTVTRVENSLVIEVADRGRGFTDAVIQRLGTPYQSTKGRVGRGLGLFLSINVAQSLGGTLAARNVLKGGAVVTMTLPLSALTIPPDESVRQ